MNSYFIVFILMAACGLVGALGPPRTLGGSNMRKAIEDADRSLRQIRSKADARRAAHKNLILFVSLIAVVALLALMLDGLL
jgi:hypothetical protein